MTAKCPECDRAPFGYLCRAHHAQYVAWHNAQLRKQGDSVAAYVDAYARFPRRESAVFALATPQPLALPPRRTLRRSYGVAP